MNSSEYATVGFFWMNAAEGWIDVNYDKLNTKVNMKIEANFSICKRSLLIDLILGSSVICWKFC